MKNYIFSLDIGTRTIIGIVGEYKDGILNILGTEKLEHKKRAMYDGQIHDINSVAEIVKKVKDSLEEKTGLNLKKVSIAAAGRSLETIRTRVTIDTDIAQEITKRDIRSAEIEAIQKAQKELDGNIGKNPGVEDKYHCVGHSVIKSYLDDIEIENLEGHRGNSITVELIATFLPHTVINSLHSVMDRVSLEIENMTLEPIAAMEVAVKKDLRLLNLALVDIGAGTSDIAITKEGTVHSYDMVPVAGDEITEFILKKYLLDYDEAERIKTSLSEEEEIEYIDILGIKNKVKTEEIISSIDEALDQLAEKICERIVDINEKSPSAVFLIGGGAQIPKLSGKLADKLDIPRERVALRDTSIIENVKNIDTDILKSDGITPIGIAINSILNNHKNFIEVNCNDSWVKLFNSGDTKIIDLMLTIGYNPRNLIAKRGKTIEYSLDGEKIESAGSIGENAEIAVNGRVVDLEYFLEDQDEVKIKSATEGKSGAKKLEYILDYDKYIYLNGNKEYVLRDVKVNGQYVDRNYIVEDGDSIITKQVYKIGDLYDEFKISESEKLFNDEKALDKEYTLETGEAIYSGISETLELESRLEETDNQPIGNITMDIDKTELNELSEFKEKDQAINNRLNIIVNGETRSIDHDKKEFCFVDIFDYIDFDRSKLKGKLNLLVNGENAEYLKPIKDGDVLKIYWSNIE